MNAAKTRLTFLEGQARAFDCKAAKKLNYFKNDASLSLLVGIALSCVLN